MPAAHQVPRPGLDHPHDEPKDPRRVGAAVDEVAEEDRPPPLGMAGLAAPEPRQERPQLRGAAVDVADDVEGAGLPPAVVVERNPLDGRLLDLLGSSQDEDVPEPLPSEAAERLPERAELRAVRREPPRLSSDLDLGHSGVGPEAI